MLMKGVRPQSFADAILEVAAKKHMQLQIFSEFEFRRHKAFNRDTEMLSAFSDPLRYDVKCPSGKYVTSVLQMHHQEIRQHLDREVKKRSFD